MKLIIANILSFMPLLFFTFEFINILVKYYKKINFNNNLKYYFGLLLSPTLAQFLKYIIPYPKWMHNYTMRPDGAYDCNYFSNNGIRPSNSPAMPSGHMTTTSYFVVYNILKYRKSIPIIISNLVLLIAMGWARIYKLCHNVIQVIFGTLLGSTIALIIFKNTIS